MTTFRDTSTSPSKSTTPYSPIRGEAAAYVAALRSLESRSPWTMTTGRDSSGDYFVSFVTSEFSEPVLLKSSSRRQLMLLIHLLVKHWDAMSSPATDPASGVGEGRSEER